MPYTATHERIARWAKALAHPARVAILEVLVRRGACVCGEVVDELPLSQATVSQHLKVLKDAGLVTGTTEGRTVCYGADTACCAQAGQLLKRFMDAAANCC